MHYGRTKRYNILSKYLIGVCVALKIKYILVYLWLPILIPFFTISSPPLYWNRFWSHKRLFRVWFILNQNTSAIWKNTKFWRITKQNSSLVIIIWLDTLLCAYSTVSFINCNRWSAYHWHLSMLLKTIDFSLYWYHHAFKVWSLCANCYRH